MNIKELVCPVSTERINEKVARCNAFFTITLVVAAIYFNLPLLMLFLAVDFFLRAFTSLKTSPISYVSSSVVHVMKLGKKPTDKAPKVFAARLGFLMSLAIFVLFVSGAMGSAVIIALILTLFATLEFTIGFCAGCYIYTYLILPIAGE
jgi:hypothetical protein